MVDISNIVFNSVISSNDDNDTGSTPTPFFLTLYNVLCITSIVLYSFLFICYSIQFLLFYYKNIKKSQSIILQFFRIFSNIFFIGRIIWISLCLSDYTFWNVEYYEPINRILPDFLTLLLFISYLLLLIYWFYVYIHTRNYNKNIGRELSKKIPFFLFLFYFIIVFLLISILISCHILIWKFDYIFASYETYKWFVLCGYFPIITFLCSLIFIFLSLKFYTAFRLLHPKKEEEYKRLLKLLIIVSILFILLFLKAMTNVFLSIPKIQLFLDAYYNITVLIFYILMEHLPAFIILILMHYFEPFYFIPPDKVIVVGEEEEEERNQEETSLFTGT